MTQPFTVIHLTAWLDLIEQARRFRSPKVTDPTRLRSAGNAAAKAVLPPRYQNIRGSCFARLVRAARSGSRDSLTPRETFLKDAADCLEHLIERATTIGRLQDELADLADCDFHRFRLNLTNLMFPAPELRQQRRYRADIDA